MDIPAGNYLIRSWRPEDAESLSAHLDNPNVTGQLLARHPRPYTVERARAWIDLCAIEADPVNFAIADKQDAIGGVSLYLQRGARGRSAEIGFWVAEPFWGKGAASAGGWCVRRLRIHPVRPRPVVRKRVQRQRGLRPGA